ncbi:unnamed protein product [Symbiodinium sp. CCMP2592]|nr:unnamed protein product [Symbiodinium sp. CCMP2592]
MLIVDNRDIVILRLIWILRYLNLRMAVACCLISWILVVTLMILLHGASGLGGSRLLLPSFVYLPMTVFFIVFFFGQELSLGQWSPSIWIDRLCIHQTDLELKAEQIHFVPTFVVRSSRMLILCDGSYFERIKWQTSTSGRAKCSEPSDRDAIEKQLQDEIFCNHDLPTLNSDTVDAGEARIKTQCSNLKTVEYVVEECWHGPCDSEP